MTTLEVIRIGNFLVVLELKRWNLARSRRLQRSNTHLFLYFFVARFLFCCAREVTLTTR